MSDLITSLIRTWVPTGVGLVISWFATQGVEFDPNTELQLATGLTALITGIYYFIVRLLEQRFEWAGWLLGSKKQPTYEK